MLFRKMNFLLCRLMIQFKNIHILTSDNVTVCGSAWEGLYLSSRTDSDYELYLSGQDPGKVKFLKKMIYCFCCVTKMSL